MDKLKKWYQNWRSWVAIFLLLFAPTFLFGVIFMWCCAPWSKRVKWWITGIGIGIPLLGILAALMLLTVSPKKQFTKARDYQRREQVQDLATSARRYCLEKQICPASLEALQQAGYIKDIPVDPETEVKYSYQLLDSGNDCKIKIKLSTGEAFTRHCISQINQ